jgi:hypothetical protein
VLTHARVRSERSARLDLQDAAAALGSRVDALQLRRL